MQYRSVTALVIAVLLLFCQLPVCAQASDGLTIGASQDSGDVVRQDETYQSEQDTEPPEGTVSSGYAPLDVLPADHQPDAPVEITLTQDWVIEDARGLITLSPQMSSFTPENVAVILGFPGISQPVTVYTNGFQIIIKDGGSLVLQEWDANSAQLCIEGEHPDGLFRVESGGTLELRQVYVNTPGTAVSLCAETKYIWNDTNGKGYPIPVTTGIQGFEVVELSSQSKPLNVYDDTPWSDELAGAHLPALDVFCAIDGTWEEQARSLRVVWDTSSHAESLAARQDCVLTGTLYDENDQLVKSRFIPQLQVLFLQRSPVEITKYTFEQTGAGDWFGDIRFTAPVDYESIILEVSEDKGESWSEAEGSAAGCKRGEGYAYFSVDDDQPRLYRIVVEGGPNAGVSETVMLPQPKTPDNAGDSKNEDTQDEDSDDGNDDGEYDDNNDDDDLSGNRGGGTAIDTPDRENETDPPQNESEEPQNSEEANQQQTPEQAAQQAAPNAVQPVEPPAVSESEAPAQPQNQPEHTSYSSSDPEESSSETAKAESEFYEPSDDPPAAEASVQADAKANEQSTASLPPAVQAVAAAAGVTVCAGSAGMVCSATLRSKVLKWIAKVLRRG